jgi:hypothetical protein
MFDYRSNQEKTGERGHACCPHNPRTGEPRLTKFTPAQHGFCVYRAYKDVDGEVKIQANDVVGWASFQTVYRDGTASYEYLGVELRPDGRLSIVNRSVKGKTPFLTLCHRESFSIDHWLEVARRLIK